MMSSSSRAQVMVPRGRARVAKTPNPMRSLTNRSAVAGWIIQAPNRFPGRCIFLRMLARLLALVAFIAAPAFAERAWIVDEALVTVENGPRNARLSAVSVALSGTFHEQADGLS